MGWDQERLLWDLLRAQKRWVWLAVAATVVGSTVEIGLTLVIKGMVDNGLVDQTVPLDSYLSAAIGLSVLLLPLGFATRQLSSRVGFHLEYDLRSRLYDAFQSADLRALDHMASGQLVTRAMSWSVVGDPTFRPILR